MPQLQEDIPDHLVSSIRDFMSRYSFPDLFMQYAWENDHFEAGFPGILLLEQRLKSSDLGNGISLDDIVAVAQWGRLRNIKRIKGPDEAICLPPHTFHTKEGKPRSELEDDPVQPLRLLQRKVTGIGPTYLSKVLRFALPQQYGAIDTRCVRVFGQGSKIKNQHYEWLSLNVRDDGYGWYIPKSQSGWPGQYEVWINILKFVASVLEEACPHPENFVLQEKRIEGKWACADVEMALFSYASQVLDEEHL